MTNESDKPSKPQEQLKPERPVPPRQNDTLLADHAQKDLTPTKQTRSK